MSDKEFKTARIFFAHNLEAFICITAIIYFALTPIHSGTHFTICPLSLAGFEYCPGCGLGRSMILLLHGQIADSIHMHPLSVFALGILVIRIVIVFINYFKFQKQITANS
jgi:hypothetical protein